MSLPGSLRIRPMMESDLDAVIALERGSEAAPHWARAAYLSAMTDFADSALQRFAVVAETGDGFAGYAVVRLLAAADGAEAELESIVVAPGLRGRGIGTVLMAEAARRARGKGARRLELEVRGSNFAAIRLYERAGLRETGRRWGYYCGPDEDAVLMRINL